MVMKYSISSLGSNDPKKRKPLNTTSQQLAQQVAGQQLTLANKPGQLPGAGGQPQLTSPLDTQTGRQASGMPGDTGYGGGGGSTFKQPDLPGVIGGRSDKPTLRPGGKTATTFEDAMASGRLNTSPVDKGTTWTRGPGGSDETSTTGGDTQYVGEAEELTDNEAIQKAISDLLRNQADVAAEREAMLGEMRAQEAQAIQGLRARAGLGGMGLTGATAGLESQARTQAGRAQALTTAQFDRAARDEALRRLIQGIELKRGEEVYGAGMEMYEAEADRDFTGDGLINGKKVGENNVGDGNPSNNKEPSEEPSNTPARSPSTPVQGAPSGRPGSEREITDLTDFKPRQNQVASSYALGSSQAVPSEAQYARTESGLDYYYVDNGDGTYQEYTVPAGT